MDLEFDQIETLHGGRKKIGCSTFSDKKMDVAPSQMTTIIITTELYSHDHDIDAIELEKHTSHAFVELEQHGMP